ncbi:hypothetical protein EDF36_0219 [Rathayibacter sp. PhB152]|uniref:hypothetical protein n=1 Tax=Rathayibacter sp. PhB152 TaxID=2485190 RepID=UPI000FACCD5E|nr:hypothetical protein [Rathayibacter sp. PhB152]ROQ64723.1 hypothetical protein EDF36_0219 [Rathayibacter sp. PhB152]
MKTPAITRRTVLQVAAGITAVGAAWAQQPAAAAVEPALETAAGRYVMVGLL